MYGEVPPLASALKLPLQPLSKFVEPVNLAVSFSGWEMLAETVMVQVLASVTATV